MTIALDIVCCLLVVLALRDFYRPDFGRIAQKRAKYFASYQNRACRNHVERATITTQLKGSILPQEND